MNLHNCSGMIFDFFLLNLSPEVILLNLQVKLQFGQNLLHLIGKQI